MKGIIGALSKALNVAESELESALIDSEGKEKAGAADALTTRITTYVKTLNEAADEKRKKEVEDTKGRVVKETAEKFEKKLIEAIPGLDSGLKGDELLSKIPDAINKIRTAEDEPTKIRTSKVYQDDLKAQEQKLKAEYEGKIQEKETALTELQKATAQKEVHAEVRKIAQDYIGKLQLRDDLPKEVVNTLIDTATQSLLQNNHFKKSEKGEIDVVDEKGALRTTDLGHFVKLEDVITKAFSTLDHIKKPGTPRSEGDPGKGGDPSATLQTLGLTQPKDINEYGTFLNKLNALKAEGKVNDASMQTIINETQKAMIESTEGKK